MLSMLLVTWVTLGVISSVESQSEMTNIHLVAGTAPGTIIKKLPGNLANLKLLPSKDSDNFYLLPSGDLMVSRSLVNLTGHTLTVAISHHQLPNQTNLNILNVHVHAEAAYLHFRRKDYVFSMVENSPAFVEIGSIKLHGDHKHNLDLKLFPAKYEKMFAVVPQYLNLSTEISVLPLVSLDYEAAKRHKIRLMAVNPETLETATTHMDVFIKNENDNSPVFDSKVYMLSVRLTISRWVARGSSFISSNKIDPF